MQRIQVDKELVEKLLSLRNEVVLCDEQGRTLGCFSPIKQSALLDKIALESPMSPADIEEQRRKYAGKRPEEVGKPLNEILTRLGLR